MLVTVASELQMVIVMSALRIGVINSETEYRHTLESCRDPAEPKRTLCCYGRASTGSEGKREVSPAGIPGRKAD